MHPSTTFVSTFSLSTITFSSIAVPYPFLTIANLPTRIAIYIVASLLNLGLFYLANGIHLQVDRALGRNVQRSKRQAEGKSL